MVLALRAGQIDLCQQLSPQEGRPFRNNSRYKVYTSPSSHHTMFGLRVDRDPFKDPRVRRAIALALGRPDIIERVPWEPERSGTTRHSGLTSPRPTARSSNGSRTSLSRRLLLQAAGQPNPKFTITTWNGIELPDYATAVQAMGREAGMDIDLEVMSYDDYYGGGADYYATTPWINRQATMTEYGAAGAEPVPDGCLPVGRHLERGALQERSVRFGRPVVPRRTRPQGAACSHQEAGGILLRDTPVITTYFNTYVTAGSSKVKNYQVEGLSHVRIAHTSLA